MRILPGLKNVFLWGCTNIISFVRGFRAFGFAFAFFIPNTPNPRISTLTSGLASLRNSVKVLNTPSTIAATLSLLRPVLSATTRTMSFFTTVSIMSSLQLNWEYNIIVLKLNIFNYLC